MLTKRVVHCRKDPFDIYIGRPSKWGNPFPLTSSRIAVISAYHDWIRDQPELMKAIEDGELAGKVLGCWCRPLPCHGDVLIELDELREATLAEELRLAEEADAVAKLERERDVQRWLQERC